ncbi:MAG TPA: MFS transporter [Candidatus Paceibacterota bacterium]|nr:MFS transporter [Candidatus Paceibacterota bacterium]
MRSSRVLQTIRRGEYVELAALFFLQGAALGMWFVPLSSVLDANGMRVIKPFAFAASALAAFVSPLFFGAMADRHASPVKVLRWLALATAVTITLASTGIGLHWNPWLVLALIQIHSLAYAPSWSIASAVVFARLTDAQKEFGPIRAMGTLGWMTGCLVVSVFGADSSPLAGYIGAVTWLVVAAFTFFLSGLETPKAVERLTLKQRLGLDALSLLRNPDHRVVFIAVALFSIPLAGFYPYAPMHLKSLGFQHTSGWMSLAQVTEVIAMGSLGWLLLNWRLKWIFICGFGFGVLRFVFSAVNSRAGLLAGIVLHGCSFTLVFITAQIYLDQRIDPQWRARAQALMSLMNGGFGNLVGYLGTAAWFATCAGESGEKWPVFWIGLAAMVVAVLVYFAMAYRGVGVIPRAIRENR